MKATWPNLKVTVYIAIATKQSLAKLIYIVQRKMVANKTERFTKKSQDEGQSQGYYYSIGRERFRLQPFFDELFCP